MSIENFLNKSSKLEALNEIKILFQEQIYKYCYMSNIDPENFSCEDYLNEFNNVNIGLIGSSQRILKDYCERYIILEQKIKEQNAE